MIVSTFSVSDKDDKKRFFEKSFLLANVKLNIMFGMPILIMSNIDIDFQAKDLQWKSYTTEDVLSTTKQVELIGKKKFATAALNPEHKAFVIYVAVLSIDLGDEVYLSKKA